MSTRRNNPPPNWLLDIDTIDVEAGIYLGPALYRETSTNPTFWHWCTNCTNGPRWLATGTPLHTVVSRDPWHLEASLLCTECGLHGWVRDGKWVAA